MWLSAFYVHYIYTCASTILDAVQLYKPLPALPAGIDCLMQTEYLSSVKIVAKQTVGSDASSSCVTKLLLKWPKWQGPDGYAAGPDLSEIMVSLSNHLS